MRRLRARTSVMLGAAAVIAALFTAAPEAVLANHAVTCSESGAVNRFAGNLIAYAGVTGTSATINPGDMAVCSSASDNTRNDAVWVAVDDDFYGMDIVQDGFTKCIEPAYSICDGGLHDFYAWGRDHRAGGCSGFADHPPVAVSTGSTGSTSFQVDKAASGWQFWHGGSLDDTIASSAICWTSRKSSWLGESWDIGDAIGGSSVLPSNVTSARYQKTSGGTWYSPGWTLQCPNDDLAIYHCTTTGTSSIKLYTAH